MARDKQQGKSADAGSGELPLTSSAADAASSSDSTNAFFEQLEQENTALREQVARLTETVEKQASRIEELEANGAARATDRSSAGGNQRMPLNVAFSEHARAAERRGDVVAHSQLNELAIAAGSLKRKMSAAVGQHEGEIGDVIDQVHEFL